jgi:spore germination protein KC
MGRSKGFACCSILFLLLTGCWSVQEIDNLAITNVIGIDQNEAGEVVVTALFVKPYAVFPHTNGGIGSDQERFILEQASGRSIFQAIGTLSSSVSETIYLGHVETIVFGEKAARERMESSLDFFKRKNDFRPNVRLLVTRGTASALLQAEPQLSVTLGSELKDLSTSNRFSTARMVRDLSQFTEALASNTMDPVTGAVQFAVDRGVTSNHPDSLLLQETAVFKGAKLIGFLDQRETRGLLWLQGKLNNDIVVMDCGGNDTGTVSLIMRGAESKKSPHLSGDTPSFDVDIRVEADIGEFTCSERGVDSIQMDRLNKQLASRVREETTAVLQKAKEQWQTDIFGFGKSMYRKYPEQWSRLAPEWRNGALRDMKVNIKVEANISRYGLLKDPVKADESR